MAEDLEDPREVPWHPRFAPSVVGHDAEIARFHDAIASGRPDHAWLISGPRGVGKATLAYKLAEHVLSLANATQTPRWIAARSHPDLFVLERGFNDSKPRRLRQEIVVDDARRMSEFFARTSGSGGWRVAIVDCADELNTEAANALLKLVEEPPDKALILLLSHRPGRLLRTLRSRCRRLPLAALDQTSVLSVLTRLPLTGKEDGWMVWRSPRGWREALRGGRLNSATVRVPRPSTPSSAPKPFGTCQAGGRQSFQPAAGRGAGLRDLRGVCCWTGWRGRPLPSRCQHGPRPWPAPIRRSPAAVPLWQATTLTGGLRR
jgi:hypothetical protein